MTDEEIENIEENLYLDVKNKIHWSSISLDGNFSDEEEYTINCLCKLLEEYKFLKDTIEEIYNKIFEEYEDTNEIKEDLQILLKKGE